MNASDFSSSRLFERLFGQKPLPTSASASDPLDPLSQDTEQNGLGSSWENRTTHQALSEQKPISLSELTKGLDANRSQLSDLIRGLETASDTSEIDPLGTGDFALNAVVSSDSTTAYPGYLLRYSPGFPLEKRPAVAQWQAQMRSRGWTIAVDGFYGAESAAIARQFQTEKGLSVDGIVGEQTWEATFDNSTITGATESPPTVAALTVEHPYPGTTLSYSPLGILSFNPQAQTFQQALKSLGWQVEPDGLFGSRSAAATRLFQQQNNLDADGIVGPLTWAAAFNTNAPLAPTQQNLNPVAATSRINAAGLELIKSFEGLRLNSYRDAVGVWTIGYGHTRTAGPGQRISFNQATALLREDVSTFEKAVTRAVRVPITDNQFAALVSFAYNVGSGALSSSTLVRRLNSGDKFGAANEFLRWNRAGGRVLAGLTRRREAERTLFLS